MNSKIYWKIRKIGLTVLFKIKSLVYRVIDFIESSLSYNSLWKLIIINALTGLFKGLVYAYILSKLDEFVFQKVDVVHVDKNIYIDVIIGEIGVAGVILGLYCSSIASVFSSIYASAPNNIADAFQGDRLTRRCISAIVNYIIFGFIIIVRALLNQEIGWVTVLTSIIWSVVVIISYSVAGNRVYQLSDIYRVADDSYRILIRTIAHNLNNRLFSHDINYQNHFQKVAEKQINLLKDIQKYGKGKSSGDNSSMVDFMGNNLALISSYWENKQLVEKTSLWFRGEKKYQKWHISSDVEVSLALQTGTALKPKTEHNHWWFEDEIMSINRSCLNCLFEKQDYLSVYSYLVALKELCRIAIECREINYYINHVNWLRNQIENSTFSDGSKDSFNEVFAGIADVVSLLYLDIILETSKHYQGFSIDKTCKDVINAFNPGTDIETSSIFCGRENAEFYKKIKTEICVEGKRITPDWVINQQVAKEEYIFLNSLIDVIREGMDHAFKFGKAMADKKLYFEACIVLVRFYEYESKLSRLLVVIKQREIELRQKQIDKDVEWDQFRIDSLNNSVVSWKRQIPQVLFQCASTFAIQNWNNRDEYPDFLGECYNHICESAIDSIVDNDIKQFEVDFENLSKLMLLYQEYIRSDFIKNKDLYRVEYAYYVFTSPIVEWAQIGGLAILWGEFNSSIEWKQTVENGANSILKGDDKTNGIAEKLIEYVQNRDKFMLGITGRDILETGWNQRVENAIRESGNCQYEYEMFEKRLKTESKLLKSFCARGVDWGFISDPSEVFWVICVNPLLKKEKQFRTKYSWEENLNE